jgi:hypothetical protein
MARASVIVSISKGHSPRNSNIQRWFNLEMGYISKVINEFSYHTGLRKPWQKD